MYATYLDPDFGTFAQHDHTRAEGGGRKARRIREIAAHAAGVTQQPAILAMLDAERAATAAGCEPCYRHGAPGLWGGVPDAATLLARKGRA
jgi:hypothetical protein